MSRRRVALVCGIALLLGLAWVGVTGGMREFPAAVGGQRLQAAFQFIYGVLSLPAAFTPFARGPWVRVIEGAWVAAVTIAGALAPVVWGGSSILIGIVAGVSTLGIGVLIIWLLH